MKRFACLLLCLALCLPLAASAADTIDLTAMTDQELIDLSTAIVKEQQSRAQSGGGYIASKQFSKMYLGIKSFEVRQDEKNGACLVLTLDYSHSYDDAKAFAPSVTFVPFQDGIQLQAAYILSDKETNIVTMLKPGSTLEIKRAYILTSTSPVEIECYDTMDFSSPRDIMKATISLE